MKINYLKVPILVLFAVACTPAEQPLPTTEAADLVMQGGKLYTVNGVRSWALADLVVLDRNLFEIESADISEARVLLTLLEGETVYGYLAQL